MVKSDPEPREVDSNQTSVWTLRKHLKSEG